MSDRPRARSRAISLMAVSAAVALAITARLVDIQLLRSDKWSAVAETQYTGTSTADPHRGAILDRNFTLLSYTSSSPSIWADPLAVRNRYPTAVALSIALDADPTRDELMEVFQRTGRRFAWVKRHITQQQADEVKSLSIPGIYITYEPSRARSPDSSFMPAIIGTVGVDLNALSGIEKQFDTVLSGSPGTLTARTAVDGTHLPGTLSISERLIHGSDVVLSVDSGLQWKTDEILRSAIEATGATAGSVIVMDTDTGDLLAVSDMVRSDSDDPTSARSPDWSPSFTSAFEPGSVMKTLTIAAALQEGLIGPQEQHSIPFIYEFESRAFTEPYPLQSRNLTTSGILARSSNIGTAMIAARLGPATLHRHLESFGLGSPTAPDNSAQFPGESHGILRPPNRWQGGDLASISFGQSVSVTNVQLVAAYNAIANNGLYVPPRLAIAHVAPDGTLIKIPITGTREVLSEEVAAQISEMLTEVVTNGTGALAQPPSPAPQVAGKTGTAQKPDENSAGYSDEHYMSVFAGFAPAHTPKITVSVVLDSPNEPRAALTAAPLFSQVISAALKSEEPYRPR